MCELKTYNRKKLSELNSCFLRNQEGGVMIMMAAFIVVLFALSGAGFDFGRAYLVKMKAQQAADSAALAGANPATKNPKDKDRLRSAQLYYNLNYPDTYMGVSRPVMNYTPTDLNISVSNTANVNSNFIGVLGTKFNKLGVGSGSKVDIETKDPQYDVILILDVSDSMDWMFDGAMCAEDGSTPCNNGEVGNSNPKYCYSADNSIGYFPCGNSRLAALKNAATNMTNVLLDDQVKDNNRIAVVTWNDDFKSKLDFSNDKDTVLNYIDSIAANGGTNSTSGLSQALLMSNSFRDDSIHAIILLTDGLNTGNNIPPVHDETIDTASLNICNNFKNQNPATIVYTIAVGDTVAKDTSGNFINPDGDKIDKFLRNCASGFPDTNLNQYYFITSASATELNGVFQTIATTLQKLRITD